MNAAYHRAASVLSRVKVRLGFTLVELLVVITIIGMLVGMLFPAINMVRERARNIQCSNRMSQLGQATMQYEVAKRRYPGYLEYFANQAVAWPSLLFPYLGRDDLWAIWRQGQRPDYNSSTRTYTNIDQFRCPGDASTKNLNISFVANCGFANNRTPNSSVPPDWPANGIFHCRFDPEFGNYATNAVAMSSGDVKDGLQSTLMFSENIQAGVWSAPLGNVTSNRYRVAKTELGFTWINVVDPTSSNRNAGYRINSGRDTAVTATGTQQIGFQYVRPSSNHPGGVNVIFCDGHHKFIRESIEYVVYQLLMTPDGKNARTPGSSTLNLDPIFYNRVLVDGDY